MTKLHHNLLYKILYQCEKKTFIKLLRTSKIFHFHNDSDHIYKKYIIKMHGDLNITKCVQNRDLRSVKFMVEKGLIDDEYRDDYLKCRNFNFANHSQISLGFFKVNKIDIDLLSYLINNTRCSLIDSNFNIASNHQIIWTIKKELRDFVCFQPSWLGVSKLYLYG